MHSVNNKDTTFLFQFTGRNVHKNKRWQYWDPVWSEAVS